jgi:hypothetical protein
MPLLPTTLAEGLISLDVAPSKDTPSAAQQWAEVWWSYASGMVYLNPATLVASKALAVPAFAGLLLPGMAPVPVPGVFFLALEGAMRTAWATLGTPVSLIPPLLSITPAPIPFAPLGLTTVPIGLASPDKFPVRTLMATLIHTWTITHIVVGPSGPVGPML